MKPSEIVKTTKFNTHEYKCIDDSAMLLLELLVKWVVKSDNS